MKEALQLILGLWEQTPFTFHGQYFHAENAILEPKPLQKPHPPILIGGVGPKITLAIIAELGDACNLWGPPAYFTEQRETLKRHCDRVGRDESTIERPPTTSSSVRRQRPRCRRKSPACCPKAWSRG